jgi:hypothetical protein
LIPTAPASCREIEKGTGIDPDFLQFRIEIAQKLIAKAGSDSTSKFKFVPFVKTNKQRAKILSRSFRLGVSANDEFLFLMELKLDPSSAGLSSLILGTAALTDQTFEPEFVSAV